MNKIKILIINFFILFALIYVIPFAHAQVINTTNPLAGENITAGSTFSINWTSSGIAHFQILYTTNASADCNVFDGGTCSTGDWICLQDHPYGGSSTTSLITIAPSINSTTVKIRVEGHNGGHSTIANNCSEVFTIATIPSVPINLSATAINDSAINFSWNPQLSTELVTKYLIFRDGDNIANTTDNNTQNYVDTGLNASTSYNYNVKANNPIGDSDFGNNVTVSTTPSVTLNSPTNSSSDNSNSVVFNCSATDDFGLVNITLYGNWSGGWHANETKNLTGTSNSTTFSKTLVHNATYLWNCLAVDNLGNNVLASSNFTFTLDNIAPSTVTNLSETSTGEFSINWNWSNPSGTDLNYTEIYRDGTFIANVSSPTNDYTMQGLSASTTYTISVRTVDKAGNINTTFVNDSATTQAPSGGGGGGESNDISKTISGLVKTRDHEGLCYTTDSGATCPSSGTGTTTYCEDYGWTVLWRHENRPESYSCTIGGSECIPSVTSSTYRVAVEAHDISHDFIGFACSSSFSVDSTNYGKTLSITWSAPSSSSSSGGGGGGGGGNTTEVAQTPESVVVKKETKKIIGTIEPGENKIIPIETVSVKEISITAKNKISNMEIEVKQVETIPENITKPVNHVFSYFEINTLNVSKEDIENVSITFVVNVSLANENNIGKDSIILNRFEEGTWTSLETSFISEENGEYIYKAFAEGFSLFAISGKEKSKLSSIFGKILIPILAIIMILAIIIIKSVLRKKRSSGKKKVKNYKEITKTP